MHHGRLFWQGISTISLIVHAICTLMPCNFRISYCTSYRTSYRSYMYVPFAYRIAGGARTCLGVNPFRHSHIPSGEHKAFAKITLNSLLRLCTKSYKSYMNRKIFTRAFYSTRRKRNLTQNTCTKSEILQCPPRCPQKACREI